MKVHPIQKEFIDGRGYSREDWNAVDSPSMTDQQISQMRPLKDIFPDIHSLIEIEAAKELEQKRVSLLLDQQIITHFKARGKDWQKRINDVLRKELAV